MITLRPYQQESADAVWSDLFHHSAALCVMPCGTGKGEIIIELLKRCFDKKKDLRAVILLNKVTLLDQISRRVSKSLGSDSVGIYCGTRQLYDTDKPVTVASIQSIYSIPIDKLNLIIVDECHGLDQEAGRYFDFIESHKKINPKIKVVGFTATPYRASSGVIYGDNKLFPKVSYRCGLVEMISMGFLVNPKIKRTEHQLDTSQLRIRMGEFRQEDVDKLVSDESKIEAQVKDALGRMGDRKKIVWACANINHCELVKDKLMEFFEFAVCIHSKMSQSERGESIDSFEKWDTRHLVFVTIVSEGYDYPPIDCIALMRPIRSPVLYVQTVGRGLRISNGKSDLLVLDYGRVVETLGPINDPMIPKKSGDRKIAPIKMKFCPNCLSYTESTNRVCPDCSYEFAPPQRDPLKALTREASTAGELLREMGKIYRMDVKSVSIGKHMSKNGNECIKITYASHDFMPDTIIEYFSWKIEFAYKKLMQRLMAMDGDLMDPMQPVKRIPKSILYRIENGFRKVEKIEFV